MLPRRYSSEAIVLARRNLGEADRILSVFSKDYGKLSLLAKGVRKPKSRKRGSLEVFSQIKFVASVTKGIDIVTEVETINSFNKIRKNLKKVSVAYYMMEVVNRLTSEEQKNLDLYTHTLSGLETLANNPDNLKEFRKQFVTDTLIILGFWPKDKPLKDPDSELERATEREMTTARVGKKVLS